MRPTREIAVCSTQSPAMANQPCRSGMSGVCSMRSPERTGLKLRGTASAAELAVVFTSMVPGIVEWVAIRRIMFPTTFSGRHAMPILLHMLVPSPEDPPRSTVNPENSLIQSVSVAQRNGDMFRKGRRSHPKAPSNRAVPEGPTAPRMIYTTIRLGPTAKATSPSGQTAPTCHMINISHIIDQHSFH